MPEKWDTFRSWHTVTAGTIVAMARENGWEPTKVSTELDWDDTIGGADNELVIVKKGWIEGKDITDPGENWNPVGQLTKYIETLFEASDHVGYVTETWEKDGKFLPTQGNFDGLPDNY